MQRDAAGCGSNGKEGLPREAASLPANVRSKAEAYHRLGSVKAKPLRGGGASLDIRLAAMVMQSHRDGEHQRRYACVRTPARGDRTGNNLCPCRLLIFVAFRKRFFIVAKTRRSAHVVAPELAEIDVLQFLLYVI